MSEMNQLQEEIKALKQEVTEYKELIDAMSVPIIPSILPETALLPITGQLSLDRLDMITSKISQKVYEDEINTLIIDFSAIGKREIENLEVLGDYIYKMTTTLNLLGVEALLVGFTPEVSKVIVKSHLHTTIDIKTYQTFKAALEYLMKKKGLKFVKES